MWLIEPRQGSNVLSSEMLCSNAQWFVRFAVWNVVAIVGPVSLITVSTGLMPADDLQNRMMYTLTLLLTMMAFKFVLISILPPVPYLTILDKYVLTGFGMISLDGERPMRC